jgi:cobalt-zinc-cadmium efflux system outer membrane protein
VLTRLGCPVWAVIGIMACWVQPTAAAAQVLRMSLSEALVRVQQRTPEVVLADSAVLEVQARRAGAGILLPTNPRLALDVRPPFSGAGIGDLGYSATLDATFDLGGAPGARIREVERDVELARAQRNIEYVHARLRVVSAYLGVQLAALRITEARASIELARRVLDAAQKRIEAGAASDFEQVSAQLELSKLEAAEQAAWREHDEQLMALRDVLDVAAEQPLELSTPIDAPAALPQLSGYLQEAQRSHPELIASQARLRSLQASRERLERETFPRLGLYAGVDAAPKSPAFGVLGVTGELPFAQRNQGPRAVVARATESERTRHELQKRRIAREVSAAWTAHERRRAELEVLTRSALPAAQRAFELAELGWRAGRFDWFRVALAARDLAQVRAARVEALSALWTQRIVLARAKGGDVP